LRADVFTMVFSRRLADYKRFRWLIRTPERRNKLAESLQDNRFPLQIIFAGRAWPTDKYANDTIKMIYKFVEEYHLQDRVLFVEDWNSERAKVVEAVADLALNSPIPHMEAGGISPLKIMSNLALAACTPDGWPLKMLRKIFKVRRAGEAQDKELAADFAHGEAGVFYYDTMDEFLDLLNTVFLPMYYLNRRQAAPVVWINYAKQAMLTAMLYFNMTRLVEEQWNNHFRPILENIQAYQLALNTVFRGEDVTAQESEQVSAFAEAEISRHAQVQERLHRLINQVQIDQVSIVTLEDQLLATMDDAGKILQPAKEIYATEPIRVTAQIRAPPELEIGSDLQCVVYCFRDNRLELGANEKEEREFVNADRTHQAELMEMVAYDQKKELPPSKVSSLSLKPATGQ